jgi:ADP-ribose pyrophosphatase YjhB (NUDIX family)
MENHSHAFRLYARAVIFDEFHESVLLIKKHSSQKIGPGAWLLPGGTVEFGEDIEASLIREIKEETNLHIVDLKLITMKKMVIQDTHWLGVYYFGRVERTTDLKNLEESKHETVQFVPLKDVPDLRDYTVLQFLKNIDSGIEYFDSVVGNIETHSMGQALDRYVSIKMHHLVRINHESFSRVRVIGSYDRSVHVSKDEKAGKPFNFKRPTAFLDGDILYICCFPGHEYVRYYANLVATYFHSIGEEKLISYIQSSDAGVRHAFETTNLPEIPNADVIVYGNIERLGLFDDMEFEGDGDFKWKSGKIGSQKILLLGCEFSIWGDAGYFLIQSLAQKRSFKTFVYVGKLGSLNPSIVPNEYLATGSGSFVNGELFSWKNIFRENVAKYENVLTGDHITCPSVIDETKEAVLEFQKQGVFIDPEIGHMARACIELGKEFSYLHIISDNVAKTSAENLSNERDLDIPEKRKKLFLQIGEILKEIFHNNQTGQKTEVVVNY